MKIAVIALSSTEDAIQAPPLPLGYLAAVLEQQRHIVRLHDLAVVAASATIEHLEAIRAFRPHLILVASDSPAQIEQIQATLSEPEIQWIVMGHPMRGTTPAEAASAALYSLQDSIVDNQIFILDALEALQGDLDSLPAPARHLLPIELYQLTSPSGALQTNVFLAQMVHGRLKTRNPRLVVAELRSIVHDHAIWHIRFDGMRLTDEPSWVHDFLYGLMMAQTGISWQATIAYNQVTADLMKIAQRAGCEAVDLEFETMDVLESAQARETLHTAVTLARSHALKVGGLAAIEPDYHSIAALVDVATTFGLDDVTFRVQTNDKSLDTSIPAVSRILDLAQHHYRSHRSRQFFVRRFGEHLGPLIWQVGRIGLLGPNLKRLALGDAHP